MAAFRWRMFRSAARQPRLTILSHVGQLSTSKKNRLVCRVCRVGKIVYKPFLKLQFMRSAGWVGEKWKDGNVVVSGPVGNRMFLSRAAWFHNNYTMNRCGQYLNAQVKAM